MIKKKIAYTPLYEQVKKDILSRIIAGDWTPGSFLPNEFALADQYGVSQGTLRKALNELTAEKYLVRYQGKGTAVAVVEEDSSLFPFFFLCRKDEKHISPVSQIQSIEKVKASKKIALALKSKENCDILQIRRVRLLDQETVINEIVYISLEVLGKIDIDEIEIPNTLYAFYQDKCGIRIHKATETIEAILPDADDIKKLGVTKNHPLMKICRTSFDVADNVIEYRESKVNSEHFMYKIDLK